MNRKAIVLGCGRVGATIARDLAHDRLSNRAGARRDSRTSGYEVTAADVNAENLRKLDGRPNITTMQVDLTNPTALRRLMSECDVVLGALPSTLGFQTLETAIELGKPYCDISFMDADPLELDALAKRNNVTAVVDCGVSPGLSNMIIGHVHAQLDRTDRAEIYVGGLPKIRRWPYEYKAPFAPADVIEEYTRPARFVEHGKIVVVPALSDPEPIDFPRIGTLEAFNTDGLRTLLATVDIGHMKEKTMRYPGHCALMRVFGETGFFDKQEVDVSGLKVRPLDLTSRLLSACWAFDAGEEDFTVLRVIVEGSKGDGGMRYTYDLYDEYDRAAGESSMARTTGFPCAIVARMLAEGRFKQPGVIPPELLARSPGVFDHIARELTARGVNLTETVEHDMDAAG